MLSVCQYSFGAKILRRRSRRFVRVGFIIFAHIAKARITTSFGPGFVRNGLWYQKEEKPRCSVRPKNFSFENHKNLHFFEIQFLRCKMSILLFCIPNLILAKSFILIK